MNKILLLHTILLLLSTSVFAQQSKLATAFSSSYEYEAVGNYTKAIASLTSVYDAQSYEINLRLGWLTYMNADYMKSKRYYTNAISLEPLSIEAKLGLANPLSALQNTEDMIKVYKEILKVSDNHFVTNYRLAYIYYDKKKFDIANSYASKVEGYFPFNYKNNLLLGKINISLGKITIAKEYLKRALLYSPSSTEVVALLKVL